MSFTDKKRQGIIQGHRREACHVPSLWKDFRKQSKSLVSHKLDDGIPSGLDWDKKSALAFFGPGGPPPLLLSIYIYIYIYMYVCMYDKGV